MIMSPWSTFQQLPRVQITFSHTFPVSIYNLRWGTNVQNPKFSQLSILSHQCNSVPFPPLKHTIFFLIAQLVKNRLQCRIPRLDSWIGKIPWRRDRLPIPVFLGFPGSSDGKNLPTMQETWVRSLGWEDPLEEGMATHSSIIAWRIPGMGEPGGLPSMGLHRVGHD